MPVRWGTWPSTGDDDRAFGFYRRGVGEAAVTLLKTELDNGPRRATVLYQLANEKGISRRTLERAKAKLSIRSARMDPDDKKSPWLWIPPFAVGPAKETD